ncbi:MAG TPA: hypothetical protein VFU74_00550 [Actinocrinis sp.]|nr:hypothetical protein [Actinocrinis sp.]
MRRAAQAGREVGRAGPATRGFALFAEVLAVGVMIAVSSLGVCTVLGALAAGCTSLRECVEHDKPVGPRRFAGLLADALHGGPVVLLAPPALLAVTGLDLLAWRAGMPDGRVLGPAALAGALAAATIATRAAAAWRPSSAGTGPGYSSAPARPTWARLLSETGREALEDWRGSALIAGALAATVVLGLDLPVLLPVLPGLLALAAVAVRGRGDAAPERRGSA